jgi:hypothetical protein
MTSKLTKAHKDTLSNLHAKQHIEICTSMGRAFGKTLFADGGDAKPIMPSLNTLFSWGYFDNEERFYHGLRFSRLTINEKGKMALLEMEQYDA